MLKTTVRRGMGAAFVVLVVLFAALAAISIGAPLVGYEAVIVRGGSMEPALPSGSIALVKRGETEVQPGSIVTVRRDSGVLITHRVVAITGAEQRLLELKGDANEHPDAGSVPIESIVGVVTHHVPGAGFLAFMLRQPTGLIAIASWLASLLLALRLLEDDVEEVSADDMGANELSPATRAIVAVVLVVGLLAGGLGAPVVAQALFANGSADRATMSTAASW